MNSSRDKYVKSRTTQDSTIKSQQKELQSKYMGVTASEIKAEFMKRQEQYDYLNKYPSQQQIIDSLKLSQRKSNFHSFREAAKAAKENFFEKQSSSMNSMNSYQQQYKSIQQIANHFRNQKKVICTTPQEKTQPKTQWDLIIMLSILLPIICIIRVLFVILIGK